jgi:two-component system response regulator HydG
MILISSDSDLCNSVKGASSRVQGLKLEMVKDHDQACERVRAEEVALVLSHLTPACHVGGLTRLLSVLAASGRSLPILVLSDEYHAEQALALLRLGVVEYLSRPLDLGRLGYLIDVLTLAPRHRTARPEQPVPAIETPSSLPEGQDSFLYMPGGRMAQMIEQVRRIAPQNTTILLGGETGTGKTRLAGLIHRLSPRRHRPFLTINCGALSASLIESEMFGHVKGAFTSAESNRIGKFAEAGQGTLFLDEIDSLPPLLQAKLLRAVEDRVFEPVGSNKTQSLQARLIVASNKPLDQEVASGRFRPDLYYRLNVVGFNLPPLRERIEAIPLLARNFLAEFARQAGRPDLELAPDVIRALEAHSWPGNVRELRNIIERAVALSVGSTIEVEDLPEGLRYFAPTIALHVAPALSVSTLAQSKEEAERARITEALERNGNNRLRAAAELGISRMTLYKKLHKLGFMAAS